MKSNNNNDGPGCTRRTILQGLGVLALGSSLPLATSGCDAGVTDARDVPMGKATMCGGNQLCLDVGDPANAPLGGSGGAVLVNTPTDRILVIRTSSNSAIALSAVCTHQGCTIRFAPDAQLLVCPCHGSQYSESGQVIQGPASRALRNYSASVSGSQVMISLG